MYLEKKFIHFTFEDRPCYVVADIHGLPHLILDNIRKYDIRNCVLIVAGDIGLGFHTYMSHYQQYFNINKELEERDVNVFLVRGNHDDKSYFDELRINFSNIKSIPDYTVITVGERNILCVGGGISIDRKYRKSRYKLTIKNFKEQIPKLTEEELKEVVLPLYFENEQVVLNTELIDDITDWGINVDYVVTHSAPDFCFPRDKFNIQSWIKEDNDLEFDIDSERGLLTALYLYLKDKKHILKHWVYGHFHTHINDIYEKIKFTAISNMDYAFDYVELNKDEEIF